MALAGRQPLILPAIAPAQQIVPCIEAGTPYKGALQTCSLSRHQRGWR
jgi:hypothetical protein